MHIAEVLAEALDTAPDDQIAGRQLRVHRLGAAMSSQTFGTNLFVHATDGVSYPAGATIFSQGDPPEAMYVVQEGEVDLVVNGVTVETVGPMGMFGEMGLLDPAPRSSTAIAKSDCKVVVVDQVRFMFMMRQTPFFAMDVMRLLVQRLRAMDNRLKDAPEA
jgi:signal-transduction protein with cAMP-binding, CBS, and nucleotidyltransferase domain